MKKALLGFFTEVSIITMIVILVSFAWVGLEILLNGVTSPNKADSFVTAALALSLYKNMRIKVTVT